MKTSKEWAEIYMISPILTLKEAFKMAQEEAIKETVNACAKAAKIKSDQHQDSKFDPRPVFTYEVDKQSIVDVEQQLKSQL